MKNPEAATRIVAHVESALGRALSKVTGQNFSIVSDGTRSEGEQEQPIIWRQAFSFDPVLPVLWLVAGKDLWRAAGQMTLSAAGVDAVTDEDCRSIWAKIAVQTVEDAAAGFTSDLQREIHAGEGGEAAAEPQIPWICLTAGHDEKVWHCKVGWSPILEALYDRAEPEHGTAALTDGSAFSKTFDLLLDVSLPVSVSFGKTSLQIREVLRLSAGSIVELNRLVTEPVNVIVNDCVIARGEVVVVDGNYGVRVTQLASREDRLRFGIAETTGHAPIGGGKRV
jgi:flagellar motor switch protein FliN/FliY